MAETANENKTEPEVREQSSGPDSSIKARPSTVRRTRKRVGAKGPDSGKGPGNNGNSIKKDSSKRFTRSPRPQPPPQPAG
jgi:hypothetical protein